MPGTLRVDGGGMETVVWMDQSTFSTARFSHQPWVTRLAEEEFHPDCIDEVWRSGRKSIIVWGAFCGETRSELSIVPPGSIINSTKYRTMSWCHT